LRNKFRKEASGGLVHHNVSERELLDDGGLFPTLNRESGALEEITHGKHKINDSLRYQTEETNVQNQIIDVSIQ